MFNEIEGLLQRVTTGRSTSQQFHRSTSQHVSSMDGEQVKQNLQSAAENANQNGESGNCSTDYGPDRATRFEPSGA